MRLDDEAKARRDAWHADGLEKSVSWPPTGAVQVGVAVCAWLTIGFAGALASEHGSNPAAWAGFGIAWVAVCVISFFRRGGWAGAFLTMIGIIFVLYVVTIFTVGGDYSGY